jgi:thiol-disulfide isomerase/thioredoxin
MLRYFLALIFILATIPLETLASGGGGSGHENKSDKAEPEKPRLVGPKREYNPGKVLPFPSFSAPTLGDNSKLNFKPQSGHAAMIFFVSSWCEPCQVLVPDFKQLARKYSNKDVDILFVFAHDTKDDAKGFIKEFQIPQQSVLANLQILTAFKNPDLPSVYIGDRWGYLAERFIKIKKADIDQIDQAMGAITGL